MTDKTTEPSGGTIPSFQEVHLSVGAILTGYFMLQPLEDHDPKERRFRLAPPNKTNIFTVVELLDEFERALLSVVDIERKTINDETVKRFKEYKDLLSTGLKELSTLSDKTLRFSTAQFQVIKEHFHDDKKPWPGDHYALRVIAELIRVFT